MTIRLDKGGNVLAGQPPTDPLPITAVIAERPGSAHVLRPTPALLARPSGAQLLIAVRAAGINYWDVMQRRGQVPLPASRIPGVEGTGIVVDRGPDAPAGLVGRRVAWSKVHGSYADHILAEADWVVEVPDTVPDDVAAGVLMQGVTAQYLADETCPLGPGDSAVVLAAAGGVGSLLTQWLCGRGVRVIGVVGAEHKITAARGAGAEQVFVDGDALVEHVRTALPDGAGAVFDANGGPHAARGFDLLRRRGTLVLYGTAGGPLPALDVARMGDGSLYLTRASGRDYAGTPAQWRARAELVLARAAAGRLRVHVGVRAPLERAGELHALMDSRGSVGKLLLDIADR